MGKEKEKSFLTSRSSVTFSSCRFISAISSRYTAASLFACKWRRVLTSSNSLCRASNFSSNSLIACLDLASSWYNLAQSAFISAATQSRNLYQSCSGIEPKKVRKMLQRYQMVRARIRRRMSDEYITSDGTSYAHQISICLLTIHSNQI